MDRDAFRTLQQPLKELYRTEADAARLTLKAEGRIGEGVSCSVDTGQTLVKAGLHPATGGSGAELCSGDLLLQALVACAGVTLNAVATSLGLELRDATIRAEGDLDFRGTLGVDKGARVGFETIRLAFEVDGDLSDGDLAKLITLTERYCVVLQTLKASPTIAFLSRTI